MRVFIQVSLIFLFFNCFTGYSKNTDPNLEDLMNGVKEVFIIERPTSLNADEQKALQELVITLQNWFKENGYTTINTGPSAEPRLRKLSTYCDQVRVLPTYMFEKNTFNNLKLSFIFCDGMVLDFTHHGGIRPGKISIQWLKALTRLDNFNYNYSIEKKRISAGKITDWSEAKIRTALKRKSYTPIEGIYEKFNSPDKSQKMKIGVIEVQADSLYQIVYLSGATNFEDWKEGELKGTAYSIGKDGNFKVDWMAESKNNTLPGKLSFEHGFMNIIIGNEKLELIKLFPSFFKFSEDSSPKSGTAFAISKDGYLVSNDHVVSDAETIFIRGIGGDFSKKYKARIVLEDKSNDLAILKIEDVDFKGLPEVPYSITTKIDVGNNCFVLGYPMNDVMGTEIKLTNGIISSKSGFEGNVATYQISAPIQPGNSGAPIFDEKGALIGVVNATLQNAANVTYAIKITYLLNLIDAMPDPVILPQTSMTSLQVKSLADQVKILKQYTYIIETK